MLNLLTVAGFSLTAGHDVSLKVNGLSYSYGKKPALKDINFSIPKGAFCGFLGPNGAGKSTLFSLLTGLFIPPEGQIEIAGVNISKDAKNALRQIGVVFQQSTLDLDLTVRQNLKYFASLHGMASDRISKRIDEVLARMDMAERADERVRKLNGGHRRRLEIARSLMHQPTVLLLDEPTVGLDAASRTAIIKYVHDLCINDGLTVLWATHLVDEIRDDDLLVVLHQGSILAQGKTKEVIKGKSLEEAFLEMTGIGKK